MIAATCQPDRVGSEAGSAARQSGSARPSVMRSTRTDASFCFPGGDHGGDHGPEVRAYRSYLHNRTRSPRFAPHLARSARHHRSGSAKLRMYASLRTAARSLPSRPWRRSRANSGRSRAVGLRTVLDTLSSQARILDRRLQAPCLTRPAAGRCSFGPELVAASSHGKKQNRRERHENDVAHDKYQSCFGEREEHRVEDPALCELPLGLSHEGGCCLHRCAAPQFVREPDLSSASLGTWPLGVSLSMTPGRYLES